MLFPEFLQASTLPLLVAGVLADHSYDAIALDYTTIAAQWLYRCSNFHVLDSALSTSIALQVGFLEKPFILMRHQMSLNLGHEIHYYDHDDEKRCAPKIEWHVKFQDQEFGQQAHGGDVNGARCRQTCHDAIDITCSLFSWSYAGDEGTRLLQIVGGILRVEHQRRVKKAEKYDC